MIWNHSQSVKYKGAWLQAARAGTSSLVIRGSRMKTADKNYLRIAEAYLPKFIDEEVWHLVS